MITFLCFGDSTQYICENFENVHPKFEKNDTLRKIMISDVHAVLNTLSPMHQSICKLLMKGWTVRDIVRYHNLSIPAFYKFHLEKIKQAFVEAGF